MVNIKLGKYIVKEIYYSDPEIIEVQKLRYKDLLKAFNSELKDNGIDDDGYDKYTVNIAVIDTSINKIIGNYRLASKDTLKGHPFKSSKEFNIDNIINNNDHVLELSRAVVDDNYRDNMTIMLLWLGIYEYFKEHNIKVVFGMASLDGVNERNYDELYSYFVNNNLIDTKYNIKAINYPANFKLIKVRDDYEEHYMPHLIKTYIKMGSKVSNNAYIDKEFKSIDFLTIMEVENLNEKYIKAVLRLLK